jgi:hypothetical protein
MRFGRMFAVCISFMAVFVKTILHRMADLSMSGRKVCVIIFAIALPSTNRLRGRELRSPNILTDYWILSREFDRRAGWQH